MAQKKIPDYKLSSHKAILKAFVDDPDFYKVRKVTDIAPIIRSLDEATNKKNGFFKRVGHFIKGRSKLGSTFGAILDAATIFIPYGKQIDTGRDMLRAIITKKDQRNRKPMLKKILSLKNFINVKDESGNLSWEEVTASGIQLILAGAVVYGAVELGIWNELSDLLGLGSETTTTPTE